MTGRHARTRWGDAPPSGMFTEHGARTAVHQRAGGRCELCGAARPSEYAHRRPRSQGGPWAPSNGLHLCHRCHPWCHAHPHDAWAGGWHVRSTDDPLVMPVWLRNPQWSPDGAWWLLDDDADLVPFTARTDLPPELPSWATPRMHLPHPRKKNHR